MRHTRGYFTVKSVTLASMYEQVYIQAFCKTIFVRHVLTGIGMTLIGGAGGFSY